MDKRVVKCDICGKEEVTHMNGNDVSTVGGFFFRVYTEPNDGHGTDLCINCWRKVSEIVKAFRAGKRVTVEE